MVVPKTLVRKLFPHVLGTLGLKCIIRFLFVLANNYAAKIRKSANNPKQNGFFVFVLSSESNKRRQQIETKVVNYRGFHY
jgi:hypothetical protein